MANTSWLLLLGSLCAKLVHLVLLLQLLLPAHECADVLNFRDSHSNDPAVVADEGISLYRLNGQHITRGLLKQALTGSHLQDRLKGLLREHGRNAFGDGKDDGTGKEVRFTFAVHELDSAISDFLHDKDGALWQAARGFAGFQDLCILMDRGFSKDPGDPETHWHRDDEAISLHTAYPGMKTVHAWIPLSPMSKEMGTLQYLRGTHKSLGGWFETLVTSLWGPELAWWLLREKFQDDNLVIGDVAWHDGWVVHAAGSNSAPHRVRDGYAVSFGFCSSGNCRGGASTASSNDIVCRAAESLFDPAWRENHRKGGNDYAKTEITEPFNVQAMRFVWRSVFGAFVGLGVHQLIILASKCCQRQKCDSNQKEKGH